MVLSIALPPCEKMRECSFNPNNDETWCPFHCCFFDLFKRCYPKIVKGTESQYDKLILREKGQWADYFLSEHSTSGRNSGNYLWKCHESGKCLKFLCKCRRVIPLHLVKEKKLIPCNQHWWKPERGHLREGLRASFFLFWSSR